MNTDNEHAEPRVEDPTEEARTRLLDAALPRVPSDGWSDRTFAAAIKETGVDPGLARLAFPRGALDMLLTFHSRLDQALAEELAGLPQHGRMRDRITVAVRRRIEIGEPHREAVRRGAAFLALPTHATEGARVLWKTADTIWTALGDTSRDYNRYTKRAILSGVYGATAMYWLGDQSVGATATWRFLDRRIKGVMRFEECKAIVRRSPLAKCILAAPKAMFRGISAPAADTRGAPPTETPG